MKSAIFAGVIAMLSSHAMSDQVRVDVVNTVYQAWTIHQVNVTPSSTGTTVSGRINASARSFRPTSGHIDLVAYSADKQRIAETTAHYLPSLLSPKTQRKGGARFSALLPHDLPPGTVIKIAFHGDDDTLSSRHPTHVNSIAR